MDITGPNRDTPRKNRYLLTFIDNFSRYMEAYPIPDPSIETCARVHASQTVKRHGTGSKLITEQERNFMSILGVKQIHTFSYHPEVNGKIERAHMILH
jgi:transposase InsO family protein